MPCSCDRRGMWDRRETKTRNDDDEISNGIDEYPSFCDVDRKIHIDCAYNLQFSCMIVIENIDDYRDEEMGDIIVGKPFCREICIKEKRFDGMVIIYNGNDSVTYQMETKTRNDDDEISNGIDEYPSFCDVDRKIHIDCAYNLQFSCMIVIENIDAYRDEGIGDVIVGNPFCREIYVKAKRFDGMITIYNGNDSVTYQMVRSHPGFKHRTNKKCNKMRPLLKISARDQLSGISHPYQKLKSFYKGILNLGPEYIMDAKIEEWLTRGHVSIHEME
ncbi:hypothetical protein Tco_0699665 [Tanacetum coccineum]